MKSEFYSFPASPADLNMHHSALERPSPPFAISPPGPYAPQVASIYPWAPRLGTTKPFSQTMAYMFKHDKNSDGIMPHLQFEIGAVDVVCLSFQVVYPLLPFVSASRCGSSDRQNKTNHSLILQQLW